MKAYWQPKAANMYWPGRLCGKFGENVNRTSPRRTPMHWECTSSNAADVTCLIGRYVLSLYFVGHSR